MEIRHGLSNRSDCHELHLDAYFCRSWVLYPICLHEASERYDDCSFVERALIHEIGLIIVQTVLFNLQADMIRSYNPVRAQSAQDIFQHIDLNQKRIYVTLRTSLQSPACALSKSNLGVVPKKIAYRIKITLQEVIAINCILKRDYSSTNELNDRKGLISHCLVCKTLSLGCTF